MTVILYSGVLPLVSVAISLFFFTSILRDEHIRLLDWNRHEDANGV